MSLHLALFPPLYLYRLITSVAVLSHVVCFPKGYTHTRARGRIWCHFGFLFPRSLDESNRKNRSKMKGRTSTSSSFFFPLPFFLKTIAFSLYLQIASCGEMRWLNPRNRHSPVSESLREREREKRNVRRRIFRKCWAQGEPIRDYVHETHIWSENESIRGKGRKPMVFYGHLLLKGSWRKRFLSL